jgi:S-DNA-T family DNA segregation ATPase FtsK/SpoIIIE
MKENREYGTLDLIYSHSPMPSEVEWSSDWLKSNDLVIGQTRSKLVKTRFSDVPHLLIAGQTGGGKSTFLRQLITAQFLSDPSTEFILVDLKGGLEFQMFQDLARVDVKPDINSAVATLEKFESILNARMSILKDNKCKDRDAYLQWCASKDQNPHVNIASRYVIVIDEAAEMFLAGSHASAAEIQKARYVISKIARQGRAVGVQLIIATQRPDGRSLDPQVKANLTGVVCFQMANDASSIVVLGCGRASDLPAIPGRAIWKSGAVLVEVQIPYMSPNLVEELLVNHRIVTEQKPSVQQQANATVAV